MDTNKMTNTSMPVDTDAAAAEARKEAQAIAWCNRMSRKLDNKRSKTKRRGGSYADHR